MRMLSTIRAVTFDAGGTLLEPWPSVGHVYAGVAAGCGAGDFAPEMLSDRFFSAWKAKAGFDYSILAWRRLVEATFEGILPAAQVEELFPMLYRRFAEANAWRVFADVIPTLRQLRAAGFKLGLISNWDERLRPLLADLKLAEHFDALTISVEAGATKPSMMIFQRAAAALELPPGSILHVGDSVEEDLRGAEAAGFSALLVDRREADGWALSSLWAVPAALAMAPPAAWPD